jgi:integrase
MSQRVYLTKTFIEAAKRTPATGRIEYRDAEVRGLLLRVSEFGYKSFSLRARFPGQTNPSRRSIGEYGTVSLDEARETACQWKAMIRRGIDPQQELAKERAANAARREHDESSQFGKVLEEWLTKHCRDNHKDHGHEARRILTKELPQQWWSRPIASISRDDCAKVIEGIVERGHQAQAHNLFGYMRTLFTWAVQKRRLDASPMAVLSAKAEIGKRGRGDRVLTDDELRAVYKAAEKIGYPFGKVVQLLCLTGQWLNDIAKLSWSEIDFDKKLISLPGERMKMGIAHEIRLAPMALEILHNLPRQRGDYVFSMSRGRKPYTGFSRGKKQLDELSGVTSYVIHDLRRTARTRWSAIPNVKTEVAELAMAHVLPGMHRVYNLHSY